MGDFLLIGVAPAGEDDHRYSLLESYHNPKRATLEPVLLTSNNRHVVDFVLVGPVHTVDQNNSIEAQAAWLRNHRRTRREAEGMTDFVITGVIPEGGDTRFALLPELHNPKRATLMPVVLNSDNRHMGGFVDFVLIGGVKDEPCLPDSIEAQAAWLRNHRRAWRAQQRVAKAELRAAKALAIARQKAEKAASRSCRNQPRRARVPRPPPAGVYDCTYGGATSPSPPSPDRVDAEGYIVTGPGARKEAPKLEERRSSDSVMSYL